MRVYSNNDVSWLDGVNAMREREAGEVSVQ